MMECMEVKGKGEAVQECSGIDVQKKYYKEAFRYIDEALKLEDKGKQAEAVLCYKKSLRSIANGLKISVQSSQVSSNEFKSYRSTRDKLTKVHEEVVHRLGVLNVPIATGNSQEQGAMAMEIESDAMSDEMTKVTSYREEMEGVHPIPRSDEDVQTEQRAKPSAPPNEVHNSDGAVPFTNEGSNKTWHDTKELINIEEGVCLFYVNGTDVSTWASYCALQVFQIFKEKIDEISPPAFLKCGDWMFPMEPMQSPVLKTAHRTYMFPDMADIGQKLNDLSSLPCVGIVLSDLVPEALVTRFERVLTLYCDFRKEAPNKVHEKPKRPPPPVLKEKDGGEHSRLSTDTKSPTAVESSIETIVAEPGVVDIPSNDKENKISAVITRGIHIGSQWISWGFLKGSEFASSMVEKGSNSLQKRIKPNPESASVSPEVSRNIRQLHQTTGSVVQISSFLASTLGTLIVNLGKNLAPLVVQQGQKLLPEKYKVDNNKKTQDVIDNAKKVAVAGLQGFSLVFLALEQSGKNLYQSIHKAAVETMQHKYGEEVGEVTNDAMGAAGNTAQVIWNVRKLGPKAIAKRTAKETGKAIIEYDEQNNPYASYHKNGIG